MLKKLSVIFVVYMMLITGSLINVSAEEYNGFEYTIENNEATVTGYKGSYEKNLKIPSEINGYKVTKLDGNFTSEEYIFDGGHTWPYNPSSLTLPNTLEEITLPQNTPYNSIFNFESVLFEENNDNFYVENGCIYSKDKKVLYFIPKGLKNLAFKSETKVVNLCNLENTELEKLDIPNTITTIYLVDNTYLYLPNTLKELEIDANIDYSNYIKINSDYLTKLSFGSNVTSLENMVIDCTYLNELSFSNNLKTLPSITSGSLKNIHIPESVEDVTEFTDSQLPKLESIIVDEKNKTVKSVNGALYQDGILEYYPEGKKDESYEVPEGTTKISIHNSFLKNLKLPNSLSKMDLRRCYSLEIINIPENITTFNEDTIYFYTFIGCNNLKSITVDEKNQKYTTSNGALYSKDYTTLYKWFDRNTNVPEINNKTTKIEISAFDSCDNVESIDLKNVTDVVYGAFTNCKNLKDVNYSKVQSLGAFSFMNCTALKEANLPETLNSIGEYTFNNCTDLVTAYIPQNVEEIYEDNYDTYIFNNCDKLTNVTVNKNNQKYIVDNNTFYTKDYKTLIRQLDKSIESFNTKAETEFISPTAFINCKKLKSVNTNNVTTIMYGGFANCDSLKDMQLSNVSNLASCVFASCNSLKTFKMPDNLKRLSSKALFSNCKSLVNIDLNNVTYLDIQTFMGCSSLKYVIIPRNVEEVSRGYSYKFKPTCKLYVYKDSKAKESIDSHNKLSDWYDDFEKIEYTIINEYTNKDTNIEVQLGANVDESTKLKVEQITSGEDYDAIANYSNNFNLYDIAFYKDEEKVEVDGTAIVRIPVKEGMDGSKCKVYYNDNGTYTDMNAVYKDGYMEFKTDHFGQYIVTDSELPTTALGDVNGDGEINFLDAIMVLRYDAEIIELEESQLKVADVNGDGEVNFLDAIMILRYDAEIIDSF